MVKINNLTKQYFSGKSSFYAINDINLNIHDNEFISILGRSGSGKSTLLHLIGGLDEQTNGSVFYNDVDILKLPENKRTEFRNKNIGFVFQQYFLIPELSVMENIVLPSIVINKKYDKEYFTYIVKRLEMEDRLNHLPSQLSGGQQQRVAIARAIINKPMIVLCDEPTGNLDFATSCNVMELFKFINEEFKITFMIVTHDHEISKQTKRIINLMDGKIVDDVDN